jgi:DNA-binding FadR family transcriptional regulator
LAFHRAIAKAAHNDLAAMISKVCHQMILSILKNSYERKNSKQKKEMMDNIKKSHRLIYEAILNQDANAAYETMKSHIEFFSTDLV